MGSFSFEFFPPKGPKGAKRLAAAREQLAALGPEFFSVTFGAGGSTRSGTLKTVVETMDATGIEAAPHLSCIEGTRASLRGFLDSYRQAGVRRIVALRGDLPPGMESPGELSYASELVALIRAEYDDAFHLEVGCYPEVHPQTPDPEADLANFVRKVDAGADSAMTQYFYNADGYFEFVERATARGVEIPIVPGVMPIPNWPQIERFSGLCGADIPRWIAQRMQAYDQASDAESVLAFGIDVVTRLCRRLLDGGAPSLHFYTLNKAEPTASIWRNLGLPAAGKSPVREAG
ncbi:MAG: methylenetetrahydrofolate reductase [NAD(P)H] [Salinisphaera sp.]|nr:methylenetetrahydrofolate reductase [NAD(P)H] [Salinisphaera sp.]